MKRTTAPAVKEPITTLSAEQKIQVLNSIIPGSLLGRMSLGNALGKQYGGARDIYQALGYEKEITFEKYAGRYERQDMAKAVINRPISYTWKGDIVVGEEGKEESTFADAWDSLYKELKLKSKFVRLDKLSSVGAYGIMLMGYSDVSMNEDFQKQVEKSGNLELLYVKPLDQGSAPIKTYETDPNNPRFGLPKLYDLTFIQDGSDKEITITVHHSRILHVVPEPLASEVFGEPPLKGIWNRLVDLEKLVGGSAEMFWRGARPGYKAKIAEGYQLSDPEEKKLQEQIDEYENYLRRFLVNQGVDVEALATQVSDPSKHVDVQIQLISAMTGIPKRILTGSERGELASTQDITSWYSLIQTRREEYAEEVIMRPFIDLCMEHGILPEVEEYTIIWTDLFSPSDKEKAEVGKIRTEALKAYSDSPTAQLVMPPDMFLKLIMGLEEEQLEEVVKAMEKAMEEEEKAIEEENRLMEEEKLRQEKEGIVEEEEEEEDENNPKPEPKPRRTR